MESALFIVCDPLRTVARDADRARQLADVVTSCRLAGWSPDNARTLAVFLLARGMRAGEVRRMFSIASESTQ